jgi:thioesterase domain-containing protein
MLVPLQTSGSKPPLFFVHGVRGIIFSLGPNFARGLGADQPVYLFNAEGMDGRRSAIDDVGQMVLAYYADIQRARPEGPLRIGAMCSGCLIAMELARKLQEDGRQTGSVILADPPPVPFGYDKRRNSVDYRQPHIAERLYGKVRAEMLESASRHRDDLPFDPTDARQLHAAILTATRSLIAFAKYSPRPFSGAADIILSPERAPGFFHPMMPWSKLLPGTRTVHVLPWTHHELFGPGRKTLARLMRLLLEWGPNSGTPIEREMQPAIPPASRTGNATRDSASLAVNLVGSATS